MIGAPARPRMDPEDTTASNPPFPRKGEIGVTPGRDLAAASIVGVVAILAIILGLLMPNPEKNIFTAPGFMPILTGLSLLAMSIGLGAGALKRGGRIGTESLTRRIAGQIFRRL